MDMLLQDKVALVTGAGSGIGRETALAFVREGAKVVIADIQVTGGEETAHLVARAGGEAIFVKADVSASGDVENLIDVIVNRFGRLDCAFNNAGIADKASIPVADALEEEYDRMLDINLKGVWRCIKYECCQMLKQNGGAIVNASSIMGVLSSPGIGAYSAAKAGVIGITKSAALDYAANGIRVNAICPGFIRTPMTQELGAKTDEIMTGMIAMVPAARIGDVADIANTVVWLCSERSAYITGQAVVVDGGFSIK